MFGLKKVEVILMSPALNYCVLISSAKLHATHRSRVHHECLSILSIVRAADLWLPFGAQHQDVRCLIPSLHLRTVVSRCTTCCILFCDWAL